MRRALLRAPTAHAQAARMAARIALVLKRAVIARGRASLALAGGTSPALLLDALARSDARWPRVAVTLTDERWIDGRAAESNERLVRARLLRKRAAAARFAALKVARSRPALAAGLVSARLASLLPLDVCVLGMGEDGHIASLFPGAALNAQRIAAAAYAPGARGAAARLSLSMRTILQARLIIVLIRGAEKRAALRRWLAPEAPATPIGALMQRRRGPIWISWAPN